MYEFTIALVPDLEHPLLVDIEADFEAGRLCGRAANRVVQVGTKEFRLSEIREVRRESEEKPPIVTLQKRELLGALDGIQDVSVDLGGTTVRTDLTKARRLIVRPVTVAAHDVKYQIRLREKDTVIGEKTGHHSHRA